MLKIDSGKPIIIEFHPNVRLREDTRGSVRIIRFGNDSIEKKFVESFVLGGQLMMLKAGSIVQIDSGRFMVYFQGNTESVTLRHILQIREKGGTLRWP